MEDDWIDEAMKKREGERGGIEREGRRERERVEKEMKRETVAGLRRESGEG